MCVLQFFLCLPPHPPNCPHSSPHLSCLKPVFSFHWLGLAHQGEDVPRPEAHPDWRKNAIKVSVCGDGRGEIFETPGGGRQIALQFDISVWTLRPQEKKGFRQMSGFGLLHCSFRFDLFFKTAKLFTHMCSCKIQNNSRLILTWGQNTNTNKILIKTIVIKELRSPKSDVLTLTKPWYIKYCDQLRTHGVSQGLGEVTLDSVSLW